MLGRRLVPRRYYGSPPESYQLSHGRVKPRPDGRVIECGGPDVCWTCAVELMDLDADQLDEIRRLGT